MKKITYNKLVRDRIPELIHLSGKHFETVILNDSEYRHALLDKLVEEAREVQTASMDDLIKELADVLEVVDGILVAYNISDNDVQNMKAARRQERGGFEYRLKLVWTSTEEG